MAARKPRPSVWAGGVRSFAAPGKKAATRVALWVEPATGLLGGAAPVPDDVTDDEALAEVLASSLARPAPGATRPKEVRVADHGAADAIRRSKAKVKVAIGPVPEVDEAAASLRDQLAGEGEGVGGSPLAGGASPAAVGRLFEAAAAWLRAAPWKLGAHGMATMRVRAKGVGLADVGVLSTGGDDGGVVVVDRPADLAALFAEHDEGGVLVRALSLFWARRDEVPEELAAEAEAHGWTVGKRHPIAVRMAPDAPSRPLDAGETVRLAIVLEALLEVARAHGKALKAGKAVRAEVELAGAKVSVEWPWTPPALEGC